MRSFLVCSGASGKTHSLECLRQTVDQRRPDGVLFAGGVLNPARQYSAKKTPWDLTRADSRFLVQFFETIGKLHIFAAIIPGTMDTPLDDFLKVGMAAELEFPGIHVVHALVVAKRDVAIGGLGGSLSEEGASDVEGYSRIRAEYHLRSLSDAKQPHKILLLASPPPGMLGGPEGNALVGDIIDSYHPSLCVVAGPSMCQGTQRIANTLVINPGQLADGCAAWLNWNQSVGEQVEFLNFLAPKPHECYLANCRGRR